MAESRVRISAIRRLRRGRLGRDARGDGEQKGTTMTQYAIDPELQPWLAMMPELDLSDVPAMRTGTAELWSALPPPVVPDGIDVREVTIRSSDGYDLRAKLYVPTAPVDGLRPGYVHIHGGGFVVGDAEMVEQGSADIAADTGAVVVSPDYRLAPEHPFPAGLEDCYATLEWLAANAAELGVDTGRIAVGGTSAGGGLTAAVALLARDRKGPAICFQLLDIPELDDRLDTASMRAFVDTPLWNRPAAEYSWKYYLSGTPEVLGLQYAAPARAEDLSGLPPAFVAVSEFDPLRDEGLSYAQRLLQAGVSTELHHYRGTFHGSALVGTAEVSKRMASDVMAAIRRALN